MAQQAVSPAQASLARQIEAATGYRVVDAVIEPHLGEAGIAWECPCGRRDAFRIKTGPGAPAARAFIEEMERHRRGEP